jgi:hypothetical protein
MGGEEWMVAQMIMSLIDHVNENHFHLPPALGRGGIKKARRSADEAGARR